MANEVVSVVPQRHEGKYDFLFVNLVLHLDADTGYEYVNTILSNTEVIINYQKISDQGAIASYPPDTRRVFLDGITWPNLPASHKVTVNLYDDNVITSTLSADTGDGPILR